MTGLLGFSLLAAATARQTATVVERFATFELEVSLASAPANPYAPGSSATAASTPASGTSSTARPFYYQPFSRSQLGSGSEVLTAAGAPCFLVRFAPPQLGPHSYTLHGAPSRVGGSTGGTFTVVPPNSSTGLPVTATAGFASVAPGGQRFRAGVGTPLFHVQLHQRLPLRTLGHLHVRSLPDPARGRGR